MEEIRNILKAHAAWDLWRTMSDGPEKYQAYLCSPEWGKLRAIVTERSGGKCERCKVNDAAAVHHLTYIRKYAELPEDLLHICQGCHEFTHGKSENDPLMEMLKNFPDQPLSRAIGTSSIWGPEGCRPTSRGGFADAVRCPVCQDEYSHIGKVEVNTRESNQGDVTIHFWGECGHVWSVVFCGHKGNAFCYTCDYEIKGEDTDV